MNHSQSIIPFQNLTFTDGIDKLHDIEARWRDFLKRIRKQAQDAAQEAGKITEYDAVKPCELVNDTDLRRIKRRAERLFERRQSSAGMYHLSDENRARLTPLRGGLPVAKIIPGNREPPNR